jgi:hypothetical protein
MNASEPYVAELLYRIMQWNVLRMCVSAAFHFDHLKHMSKNQVHVFSPARSARSYFIFQKP